MTSLNDLWQAFLTGSTPSRTSTLQTTDLQNSATLGNVNVSALTGLTLLRTGRTRIFTYNVMNPNTAAAYIQFFNAATVGAVTLGTTPPTDWIAIPASGVLDGAWQYSPDYPLGVVIAATTTPTGAVLATTGVPVSFGVI